jgi:protein-tyrosine phosphatase
MTTTEPPRRLALEGAVNFRDLGGYPAGEGRRTRWRRVFRSDSLADLTDADHALLTPLGLHTLIDFRLPLERARKPNRLPAGSAIEIVEIGFIPNGTLELLRQAMLGSVDAAGVEREVLRHYRRVPLDHQREYAEMFARIERAAGRPVLIHCTSGKDRTGFGAALILLALGVGRDTVLEDYSLTNQYRRDVSFLFSPLTPRAVVEMLTSAPAHYLEAAFAAIDAAYGSTDAYLDRAFGLDAARRERLRDLLTEQV